MKTKAGAKAEASDATKSLIDRAVKTASEELPLAKNQANLAGRVMLSHIVRLDHSRGRFVCRGCKQLTVLGINA